MIWYILCEKVGKKKRHKKIKKHKTKKEDRRKDSFSDDFHFVVHPLRKQRKRYELFHLCARDFQ